jgi:hypothetical protein
LGRTTEFLVYGHGQQRRAIIEAVRLVENENNACTEFYNDVMKSFKEKSKKWEKFVAKVCFEIFFVVVWFPYIIFLFISDTSVLLFL